MVPKKTNYSEGYTESYPANLDNALQDYDDTTIRTTLGKYECRDCGELFDTIEANDLHWRKVHRQSEAMLAGMPM
jgi:hypothetical protein